MSEALLPAAAAGSTESCGCGSGTLKRMPTWEGLTLASVLPPLDSAEAPPEPDAPQGEYSAGPARDSFPGVSFPGLDAQSGRAMELLAPAGGLDAGYAAFHYGADAIYLGLQKFSARAEAENFTLDDVDAVTSFAHAQANRRRVFVALNTLVLQNELGEAIEALGALSDIGVDALIIQDLGLYHIVRKHFPELELHASTQLAVHNRAGAETLKSMGFARVVLARELTLEEIRDITSTAGVETEVFVHGALCYSYSGLCLFSSQTNGRSGNRGKCAYSCRDEFQVSGAPETLRDGSATKRAASTGFAFSMKDLATPDHLPALRAAGVSCVKIEGRKKSPLYVATTTDYYRRLLDGTLPADERPGHEADMQAVFSRPWTRLFTLSHKDKEVADRDTVGHRGTRIGTVECVIRPHSDRALVRFRTARAIERHDGLQIEVPSLGKPFGFAVETLRIVAPSGGTREAASVFEAPANSTVEVALPEEHPFIPDGAPVYCSSSQSVKRRYRHERPKPGLYRVRRDVDLEIRLSQNALGVRASVRPRHAGEAAIEVEESLAGPFEVAKLAEKTALAVRGAFEKLGETALRLNAFSFDNPGGYFVPVSLLNPLRRKLSEALQQRLDSARTLRIDRARAAILPVRRSGTVSTETERWSIKVDRIGFLDDFDSKTLADIDEVIVDIARDHPAALSEGLARLERCIGRERIRLALPAITRKWEENGLRLKLERLRAEGWSRWEAANVSAWAYLGAPRDSLDFATDWSVYVVNRAAALQVVEMGATRFALSPEDGLENMRSLLEEFGARATVIVHQDTPMFVAESCAYANLIGGCPGKANCRFESMEMVSSYGEKVQAIDYHCRTIVLNKGAFCIAPRLAELRAAGGRSFRADFIYRKYEAAQVVKAWQALRRGGIVAGGHAANFDRGML